MLVRRHLPLFVQQMRISADKYLSKMVMSSSSSAEVKVQIPQGVVVGREALLPNGKPYHSFQGVPYAVPPIGELRFRSPVPLERFLTPYLDCTQERNECYQRDPFTQKMVGSEDCLYLNVYVPAKSSTTKPLPVMVWIHGGAFFFGSSKNTLPLRLMCEDVIVVTLNYRLAAWGFLCLPEEGIWGNAGLKDQRLALQWVHDNIIHFNGDPNNVTLFGESAGAASVHLHTLASHAHKLFHKAIIQSGVANNEWVFQRDPAYKVRRLCELLGFRSANTRDMLAFLQSHKQVKPHDIYALTLPILTPDERRRGLPVPFRPVLEDSCSTDKFIDVPVLQRMQQKDRLRMPTIMGYNSAEGIAMLVNAVRRLEDINEDLARFVPRNIPLPTDHPDVKELAQKMRDFYFGGHQITHENLTAMTHLLSDYHFMVDVQLAVRMQLQHQPNAPTYFYRYDYTGGRDLLKKYFGMTEIPGACHADELYYLFQMPGVDPGKFEENDKRNCKRLSAMWANFARYGNPTPTDSEVVEDLGCTWVPATRMASEDGELEPIMDCFIIDRQCRMERDPDKDRMEFWQEIYRTYSPVDYSRLNSKL